MNQQLHFIKPAESRPLPHDGIVSRSWRVGRFTVTLTLNTNYLEPSEIVQHTNAIWYPRMPTAKELSKSDLAAYRNGRNQLYQEIADMTGKTMLIADV